MSKWIEFDGPPKSLKELWARLEGESGCGAPILLAVYGVAGLGLLYVCLRWPLVGLALLVCWMSFVFYVGWKTSAKMDKKGGPYGKGH
jgi:hypothetical protein